MKHIGEALRFIRQSFDLTQEQVADASGISRGHLTRIESGVRDPSWTAIQCICLALGVDVALPVLLMEAENSQLKPLLPVVYNQLWERSREHGIAKNLIRAKSNHQPAVSA